MSITENRDLFKKCGAFKRHKVAQEYGVYPFFRALDDSEGSRVMIEDKPRIMLGSNNYLGLTHHPEVLEAAQDALNRFGTGCTGSRMLNGTLNLHNQLEEELATCTATRPLPCFVRPRAVGPAGSPHLWGSLARRPVFRKYVP